VKSQVQFSAKDLFQEPGKGEEDFLDQTLPSIKDAMIITTPVAGVLSLGGFR